MTPDDELDLEELAQAEEELNRQWWTYQDEDDNWTHEFD